MADTYYAWTNFDVERNEWGQTTNVIHVGDQVSQGDLNISDSEWDDLVASGAVRTEEYPDIPDDVSPAEYLRQKAAEGDATEEELDLLGEIMTQSGTADTASKRAFAGKSEEEVEQMVKDSEAEAAKEEKAAESSKPAAAAPKADTASTTPSS